MPVCEPADSPGTPCISKAMEGSGQTSIPMVGSSSPGKFPSDLDWTAQVTVSVMWLPRASSGTLAVCSLS